jgi:uncharacterized protein YcgI (DUF1989 family)
MQVMKESLIAQNTGQAFEVRTGWHMQIFGTSIVDLVAFNLHDLRERFDQARTKADQGKIFISAGDYLISKLNNDMLEIVEDTFTEGTHDLQYGMCSRRRWERAFKEGIAEKTYLKAGRASLSDFPDHGCFENLTEALRPWKIAPEDIPSPFNLFQTMKIDGKTGRMEHTLIRPRPGTYVTLRAMMDCLVGLSACPDLLVGGQEVKVVITSP